MSEGSILDGYYVVVCKNCGFVYADGIPDQYVFNKYYKSLSKYEYEYQDGKVTIYDERRFFKIVKHIQKFAKNKTIRILDVECSTGYLLFLLKEKGYENVLGMDPSPTCANIAKRLYSIDVEIKTLSDNMLFKHKFDLIILSSVLEHIRDIKAILFKIKNMVE